MKKTRLALLSAGAFFAATTAQAAPFNSFDPRSVALGGAGVAIADPALAPFFNPATLSATDDDARFSAELPVAGGRFSDPDEFIGGLKSFQEAGYVDGLSLAITGLENTFGSTELTALATSATDLSGGLTTISDRALQLEGGLGTVISIPSSGFGAAFVADSWTVAGGMIRYKDQQLFQGISDEITNCLSPIVQEIEGGNPTPDTSCTTSLSYFTYTGAGVTVNFDPATDLDSQVDIVGASLNEVGISLSREFKLGGIGFSAGATPKYVMAGVFDYSAQVNNAEVSGDIANNLTTTQFVNLDLGLAQDYGNGFRTGLVAKNVIPQTLESSKGNIIELQPQMRAGLSFQNRFLTAAADIDLTENPEVGYGNPTQYAAAGAEFNLFDTLQARVGYRANLVETDRNVVSLGFGISPFGAHLDMGFAFDPAQPGQNFGGAMQFGLRF